MKQQEGNIAALLNALAQRGLEHYERGTGLAGVKETFTPFVAETIVNTVGNATIPSDVMTLGGKMFDWLIGLGKLPSPQEQTSGQVTEVKPDPITVPVFAQQPQARSMPVKGAPIPGAFNYKYGMNKRKL